MRVWLAVVLLFALTAAAASAHANLLRSDPGPNSVLPSGPAAVTLWFDEELDPLFSAVSVLDGNQARVDANNLVFDGDHKRLTLAVQPGLPPGAYVVSWRVLSAADGHITRGVYAFFVGALSAPPVLLNSGASELNALPLPFEVAVRWLNLLAALSLCGALVLGLLLGDAAPAFAALRLRTARRMRLWVVAALLVLFIGTIAGALLQAAAASERSLADVLAQSIWLHTLTATRFGQAGLARIVLVDLLLVLYAARGRESSSLPRRGAGGKEPQARGRESASLPRRAAGGLRIQPLWDVRISDLLYALLAALILLTFSLASHAAAADDTFSLGLLADWLHLLAIGAWTGGLLSLAVVVRPSGTRAPPVEPAPGTPADAALPSADVLWKVLRRFSTLAVAAVALIALTGLYALWRQVGSTAALVSTPYGLTLVIKNLTLVPLLLLGLLNTLIVRPDLVAQVSTATGRWHFTGLQHTGDRLAGLAAGSRLGAASAQGTVLRIVRLEAVLGALVVLAAATLTALPPARTVAPAPLPPPFQVTRQTSDLKVTLLVDPYVVGVQNYVVQVANLQGSPASDVTGVSLRFTFLSADLGTITRPLQAAADGSFKLQGGFLSAVGAWTVEAVISRKDVPLDARVPYRLQLTDAAAARAAELPPISSSLLFSFFDLAAGMGLIIFARRRNIPEGKWIGAGAVALGIALFLMATVLASPAGAGFVTNPVVPDEGSLARGGAIYAANCAVCHGPAGRGNGPLAATLNPRPSDFVQHVNFHTDDVLFDWISKGIAGTSMPAWEGTLTETDRWHVLNYIQSLVERAAATPAAGN